MDKIKNLLFSLAQIFAAIAIFGFGTHYGTANMRAYAIANELQFQIRIFTQAEVNMNEASRETFAMLIDNRIAAGALHRRVWYLGRDAKATLDKVLAYAISVRGNALIERFNSMEASEVFTGQKRVKLAEISDALAEAKVELIDNAPGVAENEAAE